MHFEGCGAEKVLHGWGKMGRMISAAWTVSSSRPQQQNPHFPPSSSPLWRAGVCQGHRWDVGMFPSGSGTCRVSMKVASGKGVMAVEDLNLSALLMTLCWHQHGGIPFSLRCFWRRSKSWDFIQNLVKFSHSLGCVEFSSQKWRQWSPRWMLSWGYKTLDLLKFIIFSMILWFCWKLWHKCWTEVSSKINKHL